MSHRLRTGLFAAILPAFLAAPLAAQPSAAAGRHTVVSGAGIVVLERPPTVLTVGVVLTGKGKDTKEALDKLNDRREAARLLLESLGANMDSVKFAEPGMSDATSNQRSQFEQMVRARVRASGRDTPKGLKIPKSATVSAVLKARWPISGQTTEERLIETESLREKIKAADLAGTKDTKELTPEEQELMEELAANVSSYSSSGREEPPGTPHFGYVASITPQQRDTAMADAFAKAKQKAARLAAAAGAELGPLARLADSDNSMDDEMYDAYDYGMGYSSRQRIMMQMMQAGGIPENESSRPTFGPVKFTFGVHAGFYLKTDATMTRTFRSFPCAACTAVIALVVSNATSREIHVARTGGDSGAGDQVSPYLTINKAASVAQPGDTVTVHAGTYREWVKPARGGTSEEKRITYRAAPADDVLVKGSERVTSWVSEGDGLWKVELPNGFFGDYNPYALNVSGGWLHYGEWHHRGDVYLNGEAFAEQKSPAEVKGKRHTWCCQVNSQTTTIWANFGKANPNAELAEINVRESVFMPDTSGLKYITVDGFHLMHSAENWQPPGLEVQMGTIGPRMGKHWIIENCRITNARCVGIVLGHARNVDYDDIDAFGDHIIRHNVVRRCGEAGIAGQKGATRCIVSGNLIEETNYRREFGGWETAAIKFHQTVDTVICGNLIRRVGHRSHAGFGIWMDWANQGTRITGNVVYDTDTAALFLEMNHGPILVDNNVLIGRGVRSNSEGTVFAHNLFVDCDFAMVSDTKRASAYYRPHTREEVARKHGVPQDDRWFNNIFIRRGLDRVREATGYASDYNLFLEGAKKSSFADEHSVVDPFVTGLVREDSPLGVAIRFNMNDAASRIECPWVDQKLCGIFPTVGQTIEDRFGNPIRVDIDFRATKRAAPIAGPLVDLRPGRNVMEWSIEK